MVVSVGPAEQIIVRGCRCVARPLLGVGPKAAPSANDRRACGGIDVLDELGQAVGRVVVVVGVLVDDGANFDITAREQRPEDLD